MFWHPKALLGAPQVLRGPWWARFGPNGTERGLQGYIVTTHFDLISGPLWVPRNSKRLFGSNL